MTPFEYVDFIFKKKTPEEELDFKDYNPFIINRSLSYHLDCIFYVNEMNINHHIDKDLQYSYYLNNIRTMKRKFMPWLKPEKSEYLPYVKEYYGYSDQKALDALKILTVEQLEDIKRRTDKGGK